MEDAVIQVESEVERRIGDEDGPTGELLRLYRRFPLPPAELECVSAARTLAENTAAARLDAGRERGGWWMDALAAALAAGLLAMALTGVEWKVIRDLRGGTGETAGTAAGEAP